MEKQTLRNQMKQCLGQLNMADKQNYEAIFRQKIIDSHLWQNATVIGITYAQPFEWDTISLIKQAIKEKKVVALPKSNPKNFTMTFYQIHDLHQLTNGYGGIMEPDIITCKRVQDSDINMLFVPGIVFDEAGYRIGFGGGFYDRYLEKNAPTTVSMAAEFQLVHSLPREKFDQPVQYIFTQKRKIVTKNTN